MGMGECFLGQFGSGSRVEGGQVHHEPGYLEDETVPTGSKCATFAAVVLHVDNDRWEGVPFLMRAGKGLDERMAEVRVTFKKQTYNELVPGEPNELVIRIQPDEGIYLRCTNKHPGWNQDGVSPVQLDMSYKRAFPGSYVAGAYERVFLNAARGDQSLFVGSNELTEAWRIFTPILDEIDQTQPQPIIYPFGSRTPPCFELFAKSHNILIEDGEMQLNQQLLKQDQPQVDRDAMRNRTNPNRASLRTPIPTDPFGTRSMPNVEEIARKHNKESIDKPSKPERLQRIEEIVSNSANPDRASL